MSNNKDIETNTNENTQKSETPKKKNIVHVIRPQMHRTVVTKEEDPEEIVRIPDRENRCR